MFKAFCDVCNAPLTPDDNHTEIGQIAIVDKKQVFRTQGLHFCAGKTCINKWLDKVTERPMIITPGPHG